MRSDASIAAIAAANHGVISTADAHRCGLADHQIAYRVRTRRWERLHRGVYRLAGSDVPPMQRLAAAVAATTGVASHRSAAELRGLVDPVKRPEVTVDSRNSCRDETIRIHRTDDLLPRDLTTVDGIRCTNAVRTLIDLGARLEAAELEAVVDRALDGRLVHFDPLNARFRELARRGRDGIATVRSVLAAMDPSMAPSESELETMMTVLLRRAGLPTPTRQHRVRVDGRSFRLDLAYPDLRIAIECDGFETHGSRRAFESDRERQNLLMTAGWMILRFTWRQVRDRPDAVIAQVTRALQCQADGTSGRSR